MWLTRPGQSPKQIHHQITAFQPCKFRLRMADVSPCSSPLRHVSRGGTSATQRQKFHTDNVNQCLHNKSGSHAVSNENLFNFTFLLVNFGKLLCSSASELQQNSNASSREDYCWFSHDVTKIQTKKLSILLGFYFHNALEQLKTNFHRNFHFKRFLGFVIEYA